MADGLKKILVLDDSASVRKLAATVLSAAGFVVETARDAKQLLTQVRRGADMILIDVRLPDLMGYDLVDYLREVHAVKSPILLFSGLDESTLARHAQESGADGYCLKTLGLERLPQDVLRYLGTHRPARA